MSFKFPFTNYHELNLDWILKKVETLSVNAEADANTIATYEERLQTAETQAQTAETSAANAQSAATSAASVAENALTTANSAQSSADASGALASQAATKADAAQIAADNARQAAETAQATAANFDGRITSAEQQASEALNMAQSFDEQARAAITTANNAANVATEAQATANATALELARQRTALETIGSQQTAAINSAGASQITAINNAGQAVLDSLPADYMNGVELVKDYTLGLYPQIETDYAPILSFDNGADDIPVKELNVNIIPKQSGTGDPSPSNIRPISGWTGVNINQTGKNLLNDTLVLTSIYQKDIDGSVINTYESFGWSYSNSAFIVNLQAGRYRVYCIAKTATGAYANVQIYRSDNVQLLGLNNSNLSAGQRITGILNLEYESTIGVCFKSSGGYCWFMICNYEESENAPYVPYTGSTISVTFPSEAGSVYGGSLDVTSGVLTVDRAMYTFDGTENFSIVQNTQTETFNYFRWYTAFSIPNWNTLNDAIMSCYPVLNQVNYWYSGGIGRDNVAWTTRNTLGLCIRDDSYSTVSDLMSVLVGQTIVYALATPTTYQLTPIQVKTLLGVNNVWADAGNTSVTYRADLGLFITENSIANYTRFASMIAGVETGLTASKTYNTGDYFIVGQKLYKALTSIATGATFTLGTNCEETTVGAELVLAQ